MKPKYPEVNVQLVGEDGNAFSVLGQVRNALKHHGVSLEERKEFMAEAMAGDYDHLLQVVMKWVSVEQED